MVFNLKLCHIEVNFQKNKGLLKKRKTGLPAKHLHISNSNYVSTILATWFNFENNLKNTQITKIQAEIEASKTETRKNAFNEI